MNFQIMEQAAKLLSMKKKHNIYILSVSCAAVLTAFGVVFALTRPGQAFSSLEKTLDCHVEVHQHTADCYDADGNLICGYADYVAHVHDPELCYDDNGELVCTLPEIIPHEHDDSCYIERLELICGLEEGQVVDENGVGVFDEAGNPVFDIEAVPSLDSISVEGDVEETEATSIEETVTEEIISEDTPSDLEGTTPNDTTASPEAVVSTPNETDEGTEEASAPANNTDAPAESESSVDNGETAAEAEAEAPEGTVSTETVDLGGANAGLAASSRYTHHVHTAECYQVVKELVCTIPALHVHTAECFDENGNCICGQLQLVQHVHGEDCFVFEEKTITKTAVAGDYTITATYGASAKIPTKAEFRARIIEPGTEEYEANKSIVDGSLGEDSFTQVMFDICFIYKDEEIEPEGPVEVTFSSNSELEAGSDVTLVHVKDDGNVEVNETQIDENNNASATTNSFSTWTIQFDSKKIGKIEMRDALRYDPDFEKYRAHSNNLGLANNFFAVAFGTYNSYSHVYGNICVNQVGDLARNFDTNNPYDVSYFKHLPASMDSFTNLPGSQNAEGAAAVFGYGAVVTRNSSNINVNGKDLNSPKYVFYEDASDHEFVVFSEMKKELTDEQRRLALYTTNVNVAHSQQDDETNRKQIISLGENKEYAGVINITSDQLKDYLSSAGRGIWLTGFSDTKNYKGTLIINVTCKKNETIDLFGEVKLLNHSGGHLTEDKADYYNGKVLWNFVDSDGVKINIRNNFFGCILAPDADVTIETGTTEGQIFAHDITIKTEPHKVGFTGTDIPFSTDFSFGKVIGKDGVGREPSKDETFTFELAKLENGSWKAIKTVSNSSGKIEFGSQTFTKEMAGKTYWYRVREVKNEGDISFIYDKREYVVRVDVTYDNATGKVSAPPTYYEYEKDEDIVIDIENNTVLVSGKSTIHREDAKFNNTPNFTTIEAEKKWQNFMGEELIETHPDITVYLISTTDATIDVSKINVDDFKNINDVVKVGESDESKVKCLDIAVLNKGNNWYKKWDKDNGFNLPIKDENNKTVYYYVLEKTSTEYTTSYTIGKWFTEGKQTIINKKIPEKTTVELDKKFVVKNYEGTDYLEIENPIIDPKMKKEDAYVTFILQRTVTVGGEQLRTEAYTGPAVRINKDGSESEIASFDKGRFKVTAADDWKAKFTQLPAAGFENGKQVTYTYQIIETSDTNLPYIQLDEKLGGYKVEVVKDETTGKEHSKYVYTNVLKDTEIEVDKEWFTFTDSPQVMSDSDLVIKIKLVQQCKTDRLSIREKGTYLLGYNSISNVDGKAVDESVAKLSQDKNWAVKFVNLPAYYAVKDASGRVTLQQYEYVVGEAGAYKLVNGEYVPYTDYELATTGSVLVASLDENVISEIGIGTYNTILLKNKSIVTFSLPETGGPGVIPFYVVGGLSIFASLALLVYRRKLRKN
jgi:choice-of-anchor A domain-containing protein